MYEKFFNVYLEECRCNKLVNVRHFQDVLMFRFVVEKLKTPNGIFRHFSNRCIPADEKKKGGERRWGWKMPL